jgi:hypothetical protein
MNGINTLWDIEDIHPGVKALVENELPEPFCEFYIFAFVTDENTSIGHIPSPLWNNVGSQSLKL